MIPPRSYPVMPLLAICMVVAGATPVFSQSTGVASAGAAIPSTADGSIFVELLVQKRELYVGESVPVVIRVGAQDDVVASLDSPPNFRGDAFTLDVLTGEPERERRVIDGKPCTLLAWHSLLVAVKPGILSLTIEAPLTVRVPAPPRAEANYADESTGDPFSDPAFQSLLQTTIPHAIVASSQPMSFHVLALPSEGRPAGFSGAVGHFQISSELSKGRTVVGEPLTLRMHIAGSGNFDRVNSAMLGDAEDWKIYRPTASFNPAENTGFRGEKVFEQSVVAKRPGTRNLPALEFSYFDPDTRRYAVAHAAPLSIEAASAPAASAPLTARTAPTDIAQSRAARAGPLARGDHGSRVVTADSLIPPYLQPRFLSVPMLLIVAFGGIWFRGVRRDPLGTALPARPQEPSREELARQMEQAAIFGNGALFFRAASRALRQAGVIDHDAEAGEILRLVDEANYSGDPPHGVDLQHCRRVVMRCLSQTSGQTSGQRYGKVLPRPDQPAASGGTDS